MEMEPDFLDRYQRQLSLCEVGLDGQRALRAALVMVVGLGGLGCPVVQYLAAAGVGNFVLVDADRVSLSNLHRQILYNQKDVGRFKVEAAQEWIQKQNAQIKVSVYTEMLSAKNATAFLALADIVVDCTDNFAARYLINDACALANKPWVYGSIAKFEGQVAVFNALMKGAEGENQDMMASEVSEDSFIRSLNYRDVFSKPPGEGEIQNCAEAGVLGALAGIIGSFQAMEVLKWILGLQGLLVNQMLTYNAIDQSIVKFQLDNNSDRK
ncbi:MAG: molybdopterin-synthase adenylyltransferase MoeB [Bacteroidota bacterium]|jgi:adenylyltransferase/sulfurtransferase